MISYTKQYKKNQATYVLKNTYVLDNSERNEIRKKIFLPDIGPLTPYTLRKKYFFLRNKPKTYLGDIT